MCSGSDEGSYLRLIDFVYLSTLGLRVIKKKKKVQGSGFTSLIKARLGADGANGCNSRPD